MKEKRYSKANLILLETGGGDVCPENFRKIADYCGIDFVQSQNIGDKPPPNSAHLAMSTETASELMQHKPWLEYTKTRALSLFIFAAVEMNVSASFFKEVCGISFPGVSKINAQGAEFSISPESSEITGKLTGINFKSDFSYPLYGEENSGAINSDEALGLLNGRLFFRVCNNQKIPIYITWVPPLVNIDAPADSSADLKIYAPFVLPSMVYLKKELAQFCWQHPAPMANLIIDDPYLKRRYGFLVLRDLFSFLNKNNLSATIAFIPWNWKRTRKKTARAALENKKNFEICVHGNDHTRGEFQSTDAHQLSDILLESETRMNEHTRLSGLGYVKSLVFPQGKFSAESMKFLKYFDFTAAINSGPFPDVPANYSLSIRELLNPAVMSIGGFPLFTRKYPGQGEANFQLFAFLGKPLFAVEHHQFFRDKFSGFQNLADKISSFGFSVKWKNMSEILSQGYTWKLEAGDSATVKVYSHFCRIRPLVEVGKIIRFEKFESEPEKLSTISLNNKKIPFSHSGKSLKFEYRVESRGDLTLRFHYHRPLMEQPGKHKEYSRAYVWARRRMCDIRDNYLQPLKYKV